MNKFLLWCLLALGIHSHAQYSYTGNFEDPAYSTVIYKQFGGGSRTTVAACTGVFGGQLTTSPALSQTGFMVDLSTISQNGNGQQVNVSVSYKKTSQVQGVLSLAYFELNSETGLWSVVPFGSPVTLGSAAISTCTALTATIPTGALQPDKVYGIGVWFKKTSTQNGSIYVDDINFTQNGNVTQPPSCTTITSPAAGTTVSAGTLNISWLPSATAVNYKLKVGTTQAGGEVFNSTVVGTDINVVLEPNTTYYAQVVPRNLIGDATGCETISFTTNNSIGYCGPIISTVPDATYPITSVTVGEITRTSASAVGAPAYEDFTSTVFNLNPGVTFSLGVEALGSAGNRFGFTAFIDWNSDGDFNDAQEKYFTTEPFVSGSSVVNSFEKSITVPAGTAPGNKRMRLKYNFNGSATILIDALADPCADMGNGQVEDYTLSVTLPGTAPACTVVTAPSNGAVEVPANTTLTWEPVADAAGYKLYVGTSAGVYDILNGTTVSDTFYEGTFAPFTKLYVKVVPYNLAGAAAGCTEISFTTGNLVYCGPLVYETTEPITNVTFAGISNTTSATVNGTPAHEYFLDQIGTVIKGSNYNISLNANTDGESFRHFFAVFIDWNQDGDFNDADEKYFTTPDQFIFVLGSNGSGTPATGNIAVPAHAKLGSTRMRVKSAFYGAAGPRFNPELADFADACSPEGSDYGQAEDYTIVVNENPMATSAETMEKIRVYPNPFHDVLRISNVDDVKSIAVSDLSGRLLKTVRPAAELHLSELKSGLYILTLHLKDGSIKSLKVIKK